MSSLVKSVKAEAYQLVFWQVLIVLGLALVLFLIKGLASGVSTFLGGLAYCVPNFLFVWRVFSRFSIRDAKTYAIAFFVGEGVKLFLGAALFIAIIRYLPMVQLPYALTGYISAIFAFWIASFIFMSRQVGGQS